MKLYDDLQALRTEIKYLTIAAQGVAMQYRDLPEDACQQRRITYAMHDDLLCQLYLAKRKEASLQQELGL